MEGKVYKQDELSTVVLFICGKIFDFFWGDVNLIYNVSAS